MVLNWNEIRKRAIEFSKEWENESREEAEAKSFWDGFFDVFGVPRRKVATFEEPVKNLKGNHGFIDLFWKGVLLVEHKSKGKSLDKASSQAFDYIQQLDNEVSPKYVLISDFENFRFYDLESDKEKFIEFKLGDLHKNIEHFGFIAGYEKVVIEVEEKLSVKAVDLMSKLHDALAENGYTGHMLEVFLVRILFCLFADDTGIFDKDLFKNFIIYRTNLDGNDLGGRVAQIFQTLNTAEENRFKNLDEEIAKFPYVNGKLFEENLPLPQFDTNMRKALLEAARFDWSLISPAVFGSLFQGVMDKDRRRSLGAHYTSEKNIFKVIKPLFLDDLLEEFEKVKSNPAKLREFHDKISKLKFLDPACGCGNFLVISYRELRKLELSIIIQLQKFDKGQIDALTAEDRLKLNVDQFYGIEIEEFPARIAEVAMWLTDHQMNQEASAVIGKSILRIPLKKAAHIVNGNALRIPWEVVVKKEELSYILGNPPFVGHHYQSSIQKEDMKSIANEIKGYGILDFVSLWYIKSCNFIQYSSVRCAFVSTNSISQGEQAGILWSFLKERYQVKINFAHRTFQWNSEARGKAAVHVVIIGFANIETDKKIIFEYSDIKGEPHQTVVSKINPYLIEGEFITVRNRSVPISHVPKMIWGNKPADGGNFLLSQEEYRDATREDPQIVRYIRRYLGAYELLNDVQRYCLWLVDVPANEIRNHKFIIDRIEKVREFRQNSKAESTRKYAKLPTIFRQVSQPKNDYIAIPEVSSGRRSYLPIAFISHQVICSNRLQIIPQATNFHFGILSSVMHFVWMKLVCGRLKSDFTYSNSIVYNNFPWPENISDKLKKEVEEKAQKVLDTRKEFPDSSLADLYDPLTMPPKLLKAHQDLDRAVDKCYRTKPFKSEKERIEFLFERYRELVEREHR